MQRMDTLIGKISDFEQTVKSDFDMEDLYFEKGLKEMRANIHKYEQYAVKQAIKGKPDQKEKVDPGMAEVLKLAKSLLKSEQKIESLGNQKGEDTTKVE